MDNQTFQFEHACVIYREDFSQATGRKMPKLCVQVIDAYRYQRDFTVEFKHEPGDSKNLYWEWRIYRHPRVRNEGKISKDVAKRFIDRFLTLTREYPSLLFNKENERYARHDGFVHLANRLHDGCEFSVKLLG